MKLISEKEIKNFLNMSKVIEVVRETYRACAEGKIYAGNRIFMSIRSEEKSVGQWLVANSLNKPFFGSKFSSVFPNNLDIDLPSTISKINLYSAKTGELQALIDANYLTAIKTGASSAVATDFMARKDAKILAIIGTGLQAYSQVLAIQEIRNLEKVYVYDLSKDRVDNFIDKLNITKNGNYEIIAANSSNECVRNADIICTCTTSKNPVFDGKYLKKGSHINAIGSFTSFMQEIDELTVLKATKVFTEHVEGLWEAAGDIIIPFNKGQITKDKINGSLGDIVVKKSVPRENDDEITLYESVGSGVLDISLAIYIYENLQ